jgi:radical SAM superfamily enzyme YgiQ (UPF0313 family)
LGIEYLSAALKKAGHQTELMFDPGSGDVEYKFKTLDRFFDVSRKMVERTKAYAPDLIAFSCITNLYPWVSKMSALLKDILPGTPIIVGGLHPTILPDFVIDNPHIDMICLGEGEEALVELVNNMGKGVVDHSVGNIWFKKDGKVIKNSPRPLVQDLDSLAFPDKDLFRKYGCFSSRVYVMTGRGCPYMCTYCFNSYYRREFSSDGSHYVRRRSVENVIKELQVFKNKYGLKEVFFYDDIFTIDEEWIKKFCLAYKQKIGLPFKVLVHPQAVKKEIMSMLADAGCIYVDMGIESGSEELRRRLLKRYMTNENIINAGITLREAGIKFCTLNIVGFPGETKEEMRQTYELNKVLRPNGAIVSIFYPFPQTELADYSLKNGYLDNADYQKVCSGEGTGYKESSLLKNIEIKEALRLQIIIPMLVRMPLFFKPLLEKIPVNAFTRIVSIFFLSIPRNTYIRIKESITMFFKSQLAYALCQK